MGFYTHVARPLLFALSAETAHSLTIAGLRPGLALSPSRRLTRAILGGLAGGDRRLAQELWGLTFDGPIGLAAGLDKNGVAIDAFAALGFSHVEIGTVTALPQPGNDLPRLFRLVSDRAVINRMGFNNDGAVKIGARLAARYRERRPECVLGVNIGKSKVVDLEAALDDYLASTRALAAVADYLVVNCSSPNTPGLRDLQSESSLRPLLEGVRRCLDDAAKVTHLPHVAPASQTAQQRKPLLLKIAPDLTDAALDAVVDVALETGCDGLIATNTTIGRAGLKTPTTRVEACGAGGLSGAPLRARSTEVLARVARRLDGRIPVIGVGGVDSTEAAWEKIVHGASLVQIYTGLIYEGPGLVGRIHRGLARKLDEHALPNLKAAIGRAL